VRYTLVTAALIGSMCAPDAVPASDIDRFLGTYHSALLLDSEHEDGDGRMVIAVEPDRKGFRLTRRTIRERAKGRRHSERESIVFKPTRRPGIFASAMRTDLFGHEVPADPLDGEPYVWAAVEGDELRVYRLLITEGGTPELVSERYRLEGAGDSLEVEIARAEGAQPAGSATFRLRRDTESGRTVSTEAPGRGPDEIK